MLSKFSGTEHQNETRQGKVFQVSCLKKFLDTNFEQKLSKIEIIFNAFWHNSQIHFK